LRWYYCFCFYPPPLPAQAPFFAGKTIRIVVGLPAGDAYDTYARILATDLGKHIPGNSTLLVQTCPAHRA